jgi:hypothetical protein
MRPTTAAAWRTRFLGIEEVEPSREDRLHRVGDHDLLDLIERSPPIAFVDEVSFIDQLADDLLQEEWVPFGSLEDPGVHRGREIVDREQASAAVARPGSEVTSSVSSSRPAFRIFSSATSGASESRTPAYPLRISASGQ